MTDLNKMIKDIKTKSTLGMRVTLWLSKNDEIRPVTEEGRQLLRDLIDKKPRNRAGSFSASSSGVCQRRQMFNYLGVEPDEDTSAGLRAIFHDGHFRHLRWQIMLLNAGVIDVVEKRFSHPEFLLTGSVDGMNTKEGWIFELKGTSQFSNIQRNGVMPGHLRQIHAYFLLTGLDDAVLVYENKQNQTFEEFNVHKSPDIEDDVLYEYESLTNHVFNGTWPEMLHLCKTQEGDDYKNCPYTESCPSAEVTYEIQR